MSSIEAFENSTRFINFLAGNQVPFPEKLFLELTTRNHPDCNCPEPMQKERTRAVSDTDIADDLLEYILTSILPYVQELHLTGRGDPLLAEKQLTKTLEYAADFSVPVIIETHGLTDKPESISKFFRSPVQKLFIRLDAPDKTSYQNICGGPFEQLIQFLDMLSDDSNHAVSEINFQTVLVHENIGLLPEMINFAYRYNATSLILTPMSLTNDPDKISAFRYHRDLTEEMVYRCLIESELKGLCLRTDPEQLIDALGTVDDIGAYLSGKIPPSSNGTDMIRDCSNLWKQTVIDSEGKVFSCLFEQPPVGSILNQTFQDVWYGDALQTIRRNYLSDPAQFNCNTCHSPVWQKKKPAKTYVTPDDSNFFLFPGWFDIELDERPFRYTRDNAAVFLKRERSHLFAVIQLKKASFEGSSNTGNIIVNKHEVFPYQLPGNHWETIELPLPDNGSSKDLISIEIVPDSTIRPSLNNSEYSEHRSLGVKVSKIWLESWSKKVVYSQQLVLLGYDILPEVLEVDGDFIFRTYWRTLSQMDFDVKVYIEFTKEDETQSLTSDNQNNKHIIQFDYLLLHRNLPGSNWTPGTFIAHEHCLPLPEALQPGHYSLSLGLYPEGDPKKRLKISRSDRPHKNDIALLGTVLISENTK